MTSLLLPSNMRARILEVLEQKVRKEGLEPIGFEITPRGYVYIAEGLEPVNVVNHPDLVGRYTAVWRTVWGALDGIQELYFAPDTTRHQRIMQSLANAMIYLELKDEHGLPH